MTHTDLCYFHMQLTWLDWSRSQYRSFWSRSYNSFFGLGLGLDLGLPLSGLGLALVSLSSDLINKPVMQMYNI